MFEIERKKRKTLTPALRIYIWERPKEYGRKCSICGKRITKLSDLELDHTRAYSKGGKRLALAHKDCNRVKASGGLREIQKKLGIIPESVKIAQETKQILGDLSMPQLKFLAQKHHIKVKGRVEESFLESYRKPPSKAQYVNALAKVVSEKDIDSELKKMPQVEKKRKKKRKTSDWDLF
jgi:hypothetical protein